MTDHYDHEAAWSALWEGGNTQAQVDAQVKADAKSEAWITRDVQIDEWLRRHPEATCSRTVAGTLADLESTFVAELRKKQAAA